MRAPTQLRDITNTVPIGDAHAVAEAIDTILSRRFAGAFDQRLLHATFADVERIYNGSYPGYLACDMPYHDMRHALDTALITARLIDGYQAKHEGQRDALAPELALLGVILAVLHDTGFIRKSDEAHLRGPELMSNHEQRGIDFAETYLRSTSLADYAALSLLIDATRLMSDLNMLFVGQATPIVALGHILGTADLVAQVSDRCYVERCYFHLYPEFVIAGHDRIIKDDGTEEVLYHDGIDLLRKTPMFYERIVSKRLNGEFARTYQYLTVHFDGRDLYSQAIVKNIARLTRVTATDRFDLLRREPMSTTRDLDPVYHVRPQTVAHR